MSALSLKEAKPELELFSLSPIDVKIWHSAGRHTIFW